MKKNKLDRLRLIVVLFIAAWIGVFYFYFLAPTNVPALFKLATFDQPVNILILGTDLNINAETRAKSPGRTDTLILLRYDRQRICLVSIPRDSYVNIPGYGMSKINYAYVRGGIDLTRETIENLIKRKIDRHIIVDINLLVKAVDLAGGVEIEVDRDMDYTDRAQNFAIHLKKGFQKLNGRQALQLVRFRMEAMGDIARINRQQGFLKAFFNKLKKPDQLVKMPAFLQLLKENIQTNLSAKEMVLLLNSTRMTNNIESFLLPGETRDSALGYWFIKDAEVVSFMDQYF